MLPGRDGEIVIMNVYELIVFIGYLLFIVGIGVYFFFKDKNAGEKGYFLGGRQMGAWVAALSAGASDMSAWVLMGLPTAIYALGMGQVWIPIGLAIGYTISWIVEAPRLRKFTIVADDSITVPQYLTNRFLMKSKILQIVCAVVFLVAYTVYAASSIKACGTLFNTVFGIDATVAMYIAALVIVSYTFLGGFSAVCWTDFFQGFLVLIAMLATPIAALAMMNAGASAPVPAEYFNPFSDWREIISGLAWGLGYFGMPHIIIRFMSIKSQAELKKSAKIGISWTLIIVIMAAVIGVAGRMFLGYEDSINDNSLVFIIMTRRIFPGLLSGLFLSAVMAASMSTADSQLLAASSSFASDVYKPIIRKGKSSEKELLWVGRVVVLAVALVALIMAKNPNSGSIMALVSNAWGLFGAAFGLVIILSLFWKRFNAPGAVAGIAAGAIADVVWYTKFAWTGIYELAIGFVVGLVVSVIVAAITKAPSAEVEKIYEDAVAYDK